MSLDEKSVWRLFIHEARTHKYYFSNPILTETVSARILPILRNCTLTPKRMFVSIWKVMEEIDREYPGRGFLVTPHVSFSKAIEDFEREFPSHNLVSVTISSTVERLEKQLSDLSRTHSEEMARLNDKIGFLGTKLDEVLAKICEIDTSHCERIRG